jgi:REP element-mobilizing transposase RayT
MSRPLRIEIPNGIYHVTARGNARGTIYADDRDRVGWNELLGRVVERFGWLVLAFCQMTNHYHLLVETPEPNLSRGMRHLNGVYAQRFNRRHARVGHVFQARFHASLIEGDEHLMAVAAYVPRNPVRAGLCRDPADWPWSSYGATIGLERSGLVATDRLLACFSDTRDAARRSYRELVETDDERIEGALAAGAIFGGDVFMRLRTDGLTPDPEIPRRHWQSPRVPLEEVLGSTDDHDLVRAYTEHGYTMREIATRLGVHYATVSRRIRRSEQS